MIYYFAWFPFQEMSVDDGSPPLEYFGPASGFASSSGYPSASHNVINVDCHSSDVSNDDDDYNDHFPEELMDVDEYDLLQSHFDHVDLPAGIEAPIPWMSNFDHDLKKSETSSSKPWGNMQLDAENSRATDLSQLSWETGSSDYIEHSVAYSPSPQIKITAIDPPPQNLSSQLYSEAASKKKKSPFFQVDGPKLNLNLPQGADSSKPYWSKGPSSLKKKFSVFSQLHHDALGYKSVSSKQLPGGEKPYWMQANSAYNAYGKAVQFHSNSFLPFGGPQHFPGFEPTNPNMWKIPPKFSHTHYSDHVGFYHAFDDLDLPFAPMMNGKTWHHNYASDEKNEMTENIPVVTMSDEDRDEILRKFQQFKQFDTVEDISDHHYNCKSFSLNQVL